MLGLGLTIAPAHPRIRDASAGSKPLDLAARTASVSYAEMLPPEILGEALRSGAVAPGFEPHIRALLDEAPLPLLGKAVEQVHIELAVPREVVWANMRAMAATLKVIREIWNA